MAFSLTAEQKQSVFWIALGLLLLILLGLLAPILTPFIAASILAYALNPGVDWLAARRLGRLRLVRPLAVMMVLLIFVAGLLALALIVLPVLQKEIPMLQEQFPKLLNRLDAGLGPRLQELGIKVRLDGTGIRELLSTHFASGGEDLWRNLLASARVGSAAVLGWVTTVLLIPIVLFYLLVDWHALLARLLSVVPRRWRGRTSTLAAEVDGLLAQYLRGQLLVMLVLASYYSVALALCGFDVALPVGILTGLLVCIPYVGFGIGLVLALIGAVLQFDGWQGLIAVAFVYGFGQVLEGFFLTPRLVGERIGLHPLVVIFALLAFGQLFGFVGVLLALPASAVLSVAARHLRRHYVRSSFYNG